MMNIQKNEIPNVEGDFIQNCESRDRDSNLWIHDLIDDLNDDNKYLTEHCEFPFNEEENLDFLNCDLLSDLETPNIVLNSEYKDTFFDSDGDEEEIDVVSWITKRKEEWTKNDSIQWLFWVAEDLQQPYRLISPYLAIPGKDLLRLSEEDFIYYDRRFGKELYAVLHEKRNLKFIMPGSNALPLIYDEESDSSDEDSSSKSLVREKRPPGRPRLLVQRKKEPRVKLWEFLRNLLVDSQPEYCPRLICWENYENKEFRIVNPKELADLWAQRDRKVQTKGSYENFSRAMRYYYKKGILGTVHGKRLVYRFAEMATGF